MFRHHCDLENNSVLKTGMNGYKLNGDYQVKSSQFMFSKPLGVTRKQNTNQPNHALKKVAISQPNKECLHKSRFSPTFIVSFNTHTPFYHYAQFKTSFFDSDEYSDVKVLPQTTSLPDQHRSVETEYTNIFHIHQQ